MLKTRERMHEAMRKPVPPRDGHTPGDGNTPATSAPDIHRDEPPVNRQGFMLPPETGQIHPTATKDGYGAGMGMEEYKSSCVKSMVVKEWRKAIQSRCITAYSRAC
jgi:hypothetical protein